MSRVVAVLVTLAIAQPAFAQSHPTPRATARFGALRPAHANPYGKLFDAQSLERATRELANKMENPKRSVVCGMTIVQGDPQIDPQFFVGKTNSDLDYALRKVAPPICKP